MSNFEQKNKKNTKITSVNSIEEITKNLSNSMRVQAMLQHFDLLISAIAEWTFWKPVNCRRLKFRWQSKNRMNDNKCVCDMTMQSTFSVDANRFRA